MANRIKGITVEIGGDTTKLSKALQNVDKSVKNTQTQLKDVEKLLKLDPTNTELLAQKQKLLGQAVSDTKSRLDTLKKASEEAAKTKDNYDDWKAKYDPIKQKITETESKLRELKEQSKTADEQLSKGEISQEKYDALQQEIKETTNEFSALKQSAKDVSDEFGNPISPEQYDALQREIIETEQELQNLQTEAASSSAALAKIGVVGEKMEKIGGKIADVGTTLTTHVTAPILAAGTAAVKTASDFDSAMSKVAAVSGATGDDLQDLRDKAREMGAKTKFSASEAAEAMNYMAMAGWKTGDMLDGIEGIMNLAAASGEGLATTSDIVTDALTAFGLTADDSAHFADVLAAASSNANTNVSMMGETFKYCAPVAGSLGFSCEDTAQAIGLMANAGIKSTQSGTALRSIMTALAGKVKFCGEQLGEVEIATTNADGSMRNLNDILADCRTAFSKLSESEQASAARALVGKNAMSGFLALMNAAPADIEKLQGAISTCSDEVEGYNGVTEKMAAVMQDNLGGQLTILKSQLEELAISFGEILMPAIRAIVSRIQALVDKLNAMDPVIKQTIVKIALIAAAIGPLLVVIGKTMVGVGKLMQLISNLPTMIAGAKSAFTAFSGAISGIAAPVLAIIAVVAVLIAAFKHLWDTNEEFRNKITAIWEQIKSIFEGFTQGIVDRLNALGFDFESITDVMMAVWNTFCNFLAPIFEGQFQQIADILKFVTDTLLNILDVFIGIFTGDWDKVWNGLKGVFVSVWDFIKATLQNALNMLCGIFGTDLDSVKQIAVNVMTAVRDFFVNIWTGISNFINGTLQGISDFFTGTWTAIKDLFVGIWAAIYTEISTRINLVKTVIETVWNAVYTAISTVTNAIWSIVTTVWQTIYDIISPLLNAIRYLVETVFMAIQVIIGRAMDWVSEKITVIWNAIVSFLTPILEGIRDFFQTIWDTISKAISTALDVIEKLITTVWNAVSGFISTVLNQIWKTISSIWDKISGHISSVLSAIKTVVNNVWNQISSIVSSVLDTIFATVSKIWNNMKSSIEGVMDGIKNGISSSISNIKSTIENGFNAAVDFITGLASQAWNWGSDIIGNIVDGIRYRIQDIANAVTDVADTIRSYLHFSVPDTGPLTDFESWMPDFMKGLAKGIDKSKKYVEAAVSTVADAMQITMESGLNMSIDNVSGAMMQGSHDSVINNYTTNNNQTINQTNNSPKPLNRYEIYRQTKNLIHTVKGR